MIDREKVIKGLECCITSSDDCECPDECPYNEKCWESELVELDNQLMKDALELLKAKDINVPTAWISVKDRLPEVKDSYIIAGKLRYPGEPWEYFTDVAESHGSYIDDFWDTFNDWVEGQETHVTHWMPMPEPPKEDDQ